MPATREDLVQLLAEPPPRQLGASIFQAMRERSRPGLLVVGFGLLYTAVALYGAAQFFPWRLWDDLRLAEYGQKAPGVVLSFTPTNLAVGEEDNSTIREYRFTYTTPDGRTREGRCYRPGKVWLAGKEVPVFYLADQPEIAFLEDASLSRHPLGFVLVILPLTGVAVCFYPWWLRRQEMRLLRNGQLHWTRVDAFGPEDDGRHKVTLSAIEPAEGCTLEVELWEKGEIKLARRHAESGQRMAVFQDPRKPRKFISRRPCSMIEFSCPRSRAN